MPLKYDGCSLYSLTSKKMLKYLLGIKNNALLKQNYVASLVEPYINQVGKPRLIEPPRVELKIIQRKIKNMLGKIAVPDNIFSGVKGRSYVDNAAFHAGVNLRYLFKVDLSTFFPSIRRETVYRFFKEDLLCAPDVATILTNFTTIDLSRSKAQNINAIYQFLESKNVKCRNHLLSGAPTSQILSYLVNHKMFDEMQALSDNNDVIMTVYVDDITFSSTYNIARKFRMRIYKIIKKYEYKIAINKVKSYSKLYPKLVTGVIIDSSGRLTIKNSLRKKIVDEYDHFKNHPNDIISHRRLKGLVTAARQVEKNVYPSIYRGIKSV